MSFLIILTAIWLSGLVLYYTLLRPVPAHGFNRAFLLAVLVAGIVLPFLPSWGGLGDALPALRSTSSILLQGIIIEAEGNSSQVQESTNWLLIFYLSGVGLGSLWMLLGVWRLVCCFRESIPLQSVNFKGLQVRETQNARSPFSFGHTLFVANWAALSPMEQQSLMHHEAAHAELHHTFDNVLIGFLTLALWWHPLVYILRRELRLVHEYQADASALQVIDSKSYQRLLLHYQFQTMQLPAVAAFAQSPLQNRFMMMSKAFRQNQSWRLVLATCALLLIGAACTKEEFDRQDLEELQALNRNAAANGQQDETYYQDLIDGAIASNSRLLSIDTIEVFDPDTYISTIDVVYTLENESGKTVAQVRKSLPSRDRSAEPLSFLTPRVRNLEVHFVVDEMPRFPSADCDTKTQVEQMGCSQTALLNFIYKEVSYPAEARKAAEQGTVIVRFVVGTDGELLEPRIVRSVSPSLDAEVLRMLNVMPAWVPGKKDGKLVQTSFTLPVKFKL